MSFDDTNGGHRAYNRHSHIDSKNCYHCLSNLESISFRAPYGKMNIGFAQSGQIFLIFQSSNCFHLLKVSPSLAKIVSTDQLI